MREILVCLILFFSYSAIAQDNCATALFIDSPQEYCLNLDFSAATPSDINGSCVDNNSLNNQWLSFIADGADIEISAVDENGNDVIITIVRYTNLNCDPVKFVEAICASNTINTTDLLTEGEEYHIIVNVANNLGSNVEFCINNIHDTPPPINNESCDAFPVLTNNGCILASTVYAENSIDSSYCGDDYISDVWFKFNLVEEFSFGVEVSLQNDNVPGDVQVQLVNFAFDSCGVEYVVRSAYCGAPEGFIFDNTTLVPNETYYIVISTTVENQGKLFLCVNELIAEPNTLVCEAYEITPNGDCPVLNTYNTIFELDITTCNFSNQNLWYQFYTGTDLTSVDLQLDQLSGFEDVFFGIGYFSGNFCENEFTWVETHCGNASEARLNVDDLLPNQLYHIAVGSNFSFPGEFQLCLNGDYDSPFTNGTACTAYEINEFNGCTGGSSQYGSFKEIDTLCLGVTPTKNTWYKIALQDQTQVDVQFSHLSSIPYEKIEVGYFESGCEQVFTIIETYCGNDSLVSIPTQFPDSITYGYISVTLPNNNTYNYTVCVNPSSFSSSCDKNDFCQESIELGDLSFNNDVCFQACTFGQTKENTTEFYTSRYPTSWYEFTIEDGVKEIEFSFDNPSNPFYFIGLSSQATCDYSTFEKSSYIQLTQNQSFRFNVEPNTTYKMAIAAVNNQGGEVDICMTSIDENVCAKNDQLYVLNTSFGSPKEGPYREGEQVQFCYLLPKYQIVDEASCQWLQGIIPVFGDSWNPSSFNLIGEPTVTNPLQAVSNDVIWDWRNDVHSKISNGNLLLSDNSICTPYMDDCEGNSIEIGDLLPAGWYAWNTQQNGMHPDSTYGDGNNCQFSQGLWQVCFLLEVGEITEDMDLGIDFYTFADGEIGYINPADTTCKNDKPLSVEYYAGCQIEPVDTSFTALTCNENVLLIDLPEDQFFFWLVDENPNISGYSSGSGEQLEVTLNSNSTSTERINYYISGYSQGGCHLANYRVEVVVYPSLEIEQAPRFNLCQGDSISLSEVIDLQSQILGSFEVDWESAIVEDNPNAYWGGNQDTAIPYNVISEAGCTFQDTVYIHVEDVIVTDFLDTYVVCRGEDLAFNTVLDLDAIISDSFTINWEYGDLPDITTADTSFQQSTNIPFTLTGEFGCVFQDTFRVHVPHVDINVLGKNEYCSTDTVSISAGYNYGLPHEKYWILPQGDTIVGSGIARKASLFPAGENYLRFELFTEDECPFYDFDTITIFTYPTFTFNQDTQYLGICPYDSLLLEVDIQPSSYDVMWETPFGQTSSESFYTNEPGVYIIEAGITSAEAECVNTDSFFIEIYPAVETEIIFDPIVCVGDSSIAFSTDPNYKFIWSNGDPSSQITVPPGNYSVTVSNSDDCAEIFDINIEERALPQPNFTWNDVICEDDSTLIIAENPNYFFNWSSGEITSDLLSFGGQEFVTVTDDEECVDSFSFNIEVIEYPDIELEYTLNQDTLFLPGLEGLAESCNYLLNDEVINSPDDMILQLEEGSYSLSITCSNGDCATMFVDSFTVMISGLMAQKLAEWTIYPNPNNGNFVVDLGGIQGANKLSVIGLQGREFLTKNLNSNHRKITISEELSAGLYLIRIDTQQGFYIRRLVINL